MRTVCCLYCLLFLSVTASAQGPLLWESHDEVNGGGARRVTLTNHMAAVVGSVGTPGGGLDFVIQALRRSTGVVQWRDRVESCCGDVASFVTSVDNTIFAAGYVPGLGLGSTDIVVRAYDAPTGTLLWENIWDAGQDDLPQGIAASRTAVVVVGNGGNIPGHSLDYLVRAFFPVKGGLIW
jgi:outer membrane protein assembly factor BamB